MMDKDFEMQSEKPGPIIVQRPNIPNDYGPKRLSDLLDGDELSSALEWYSLALANLATTPAQAFVRSIRSMYYEKDVARIRAGEPNIPNDYSRERLADLLEGDLLEEAQDWYTFVKNTGVSNAAAFRAAICNSGAEPHYIKPRAFTAEEIQAAIQFFTEKQIAIEHINKWGKGIDPYLNDLEND